MNLSLELSLLLLSDILAGTVFSSMMTRDLKKITPDVSFIHFFTDLFPQGVGSVEWNFCIVYPAGDGFFFLHVCQ